MSRFRFAISALRLPALCSGEPLRLRRLLQLGADGGLPAAERLGAVLLLGDDGKHALAVLQVGEGAGTEGQQLLQLRRVAAVGPCRKVRGKLCDEVRTAGAVGLHRLLQLTQQPCSLRSDLVGGKELAQPLLMPRLREKQIRQAGMCA